jgi:hypothetical protein
LQLRGSEQDFSVPSAEWQLQPKEPLPKMGLIDKAKQNAIKNNNT